MTPQDEVNQIKRDVDVFNRIRQYFVEAWDAKPEDVKLGTPLTDLVGKDRSDKSLFESDIQKMCGINIADNSKIRTVGNLVDFIVAETNKMTCYLIAIANVPGRGDPRYMGPVTRVTLRSIPGSQKDAVLRAARTLTDGTHSCKFTVSCGGTVLPQTPKGKAKPNQGPHDEIQIVASPGEKKPCGAKDPQECPCYMWSGLCPIYGDWLRKTVLGMNK